jgi:hypothetical protein
MTLRPFAGHLDHAQADGVGVGVGAVEGAGEDSDLGPYGNLSASVQVVIERATFSPAGVLVSAYGALRVAAGNSVSDGFPKQD